MLCVCVCGCVCGVGGAGEGGQRSLQLHAFTEVQVNGCIFKPAPGEPPNFKRRSKNRTATVKALAY